MEVATHDMEVALILGILALTIAIAQAITYTPSQVHAVYFCMSERELRISDMDSYTARMLSTFVFQPSSFLRFAVGMLPALLLGKGQTLTVMLTCS